VLLPADSNAHAIKLTRSEPARQAISDRRAMMGNERPKLADQRVVLIAERIKVAIRARPPLASVTTPVQGNCGTRSDCAVDAE
jgi:hypothetical protein